MSLRIIFAAALTLVSGMATASDAGVPALQVTAPNGKSSIIIGTIHVPYKGLVQPAAGLLDGRKRLVVESSRTQGPQPRDPSPTEMLHPDVLASVRAGRGVVRAPWAANLSDDQVDRLLHTARCLIPSMTRQNIESVLGFRTAETAASLAYLRCESGLGVSRDEILNQAAAARGIPTDVLETQVDVDRRRKAVPAGYYATVLAGAFASDVEDKYRAVVEALNIGDYDAAFAASQADPRTVEDVEIFNQLMLLERNQAWLPPLQRYLDEGNAVVVVGAAHLPGEAGLLNLLQESGYRVKPILVDARQ
ncbi:TraB/GumN family protein [Achromobacter anxifer]|uniref:TraB/GumN family protein n=1 Tax=Achromobacter anxifer TaxID=1287737 RepID=UPI0023F67F41|nr:TraB/GumN family protein [Achromobacter anxifer]MDF8359426.1 TraB/GumN family protein [Achromobacter anxifer]